MKKNSYFSLNEKYSKLIRKKFGNRSLGAVFRQSIALLDHTSSQLKKRSVLKEIEAFEDLPLFPHSVLLDLQDYLRIHRVKELFPKVPVAKIYQFAIMLYLKEIDLPKVKKVLEDDLLLGDRYRREVLIEENQYSILVERYKKPYVAAAVRTAISFFSKGCKRKEPWAYQSFVRASDKKYFNIKTSAGRKNSAKAIPIKMNFYVKDEQVNLDLLLENFDLGLNAAIRVCLRSFIEVPMWEKRPLIKNTKFKKGLSVKEASKQISFDISASVIEALKQKSSDGKWHPIARVLIEEYLNKSEYSKKKKRNPKYLPKRYLPENDSKKVGLHLVLSTSEKLEIIATWEDLSVARLVDKILRASI